MTTSIDSLFYLEYLAGKIRCKSGGGVVILLR